MNTQEELIKLLGKLNYLLQNDAIKGSTSAQIIMSVVPILGVICSCVVLVVFIRWYFRFQTHLLKEGQYKGSVHVDELNAHSLLLLLGIVSSFLGLPIGILFYMVNGVSYSVLNGIIPFFSGLGMITYYILRSLAKDKSKTH